MDDESGECKRACKSREDRDWNGEKEQYRAEKKSDYVGHERGVLAGLNNRERRGRSTMMNDECILIE